MFLAALQHVKSNIPPINDHIHVTFISIICYSRVMLFQD